MIMWLTRRSFISLMVTMIILVLFIPCLLPFKPMYLEFLSVYSSNPVPPLITALDDSSEKVRAVTISSLSKIGEPALDSLNNALNDDNPSRREGAALCISQMALKRNDLLPILRKSAVPHLKHSLDDPESRVRVQAATALWHINQDPKEVIPSLIRACNDNNRIVRYLAFQCLSDIGSQATEAVPTIKSAMSDDDYMVRIWAADAFRQINRAAEKQEKNKVK